MLTTYEDSVKVNGSKAGDMSMSKVNVHDVDNELYLMVIAKIITAGTPKGDSVRKALS